MVATRGPTVVFVLVRTATPEVYGGEYSTLFTARALEASGVRCHFVVTAHDRLADELERAGLSYEVVDVPNPFDGLRAATLVEKARRLRGILRINAAVGRAVRRTGASAVDAVGIQSFVAAWLGARISGADAVFHVRGASRNSRTTPLEQIAMLVASRTIAVSGGLRDQLVETARRWLRPFVEDRVFVVHNGFDFAAIDRAISSSSAPGARAELGPSPERCSALLVGGYWSDKGQLRVIEEVLPRVVAEVPQFHVTFVGGDKETGYRRRCEDAVDRLGLAGNVTFHGYKLLDEVYRHYLACDLVILASHREGLPRAAIEAQAFGKPVVATAVQGVAETVAHGETGFLVANDRISDMARYLIDLARDPALRRRLGEAGARKVRTHFRLEDSAAALARVLGLNAGGGAGT